MKFQKRKSFLVWDWTRGWKGESKIRVLLSCLGKKRKKKRFDSLIFCRAGDGKHLPSSPAYFVMIPEQLSATRKEGERKKGMFVENLPLIKSSFIPTSSAAVLRAMCSSGSVAGTGSSDVAASLGGSSPSPLDFTPRSASCLLLQKLPGVPHERRRTRR